MLTWATATDPVAAMLQRLREHGIEPSDSGAIVPDGKLRRFHVVGDRAGTTNGWCVLHPDHGAAGSWKASATVTWTARGHRRLTRQQRAALSAAITQQREEAQRQREAAHQDAARRAAALWARAQPACADHPYLRKKRVPPGPARQLGDWLVLPIVDVDGQLRGLQYIGPGGDKRLLRGTNKRAGFIVVAGALPAASVLIAEGYATAASASGICPADAALAAIDCGNLEPVARALRERWPDTAIVIAADDDRLTEGNPGLSKARAAARAVGARLIRPRWPADAPPNLTDFNDLVCLVGGRP